MSKRSRNILLLVLFVSAAAALVLWQDQLRNLLLFYTDSIPLRKIVSEEGPGEEASSGPDARGAGTRGQHARPAAVRRMEILPQGEGTSETTRDLIGAAPLPPSPPLPVVSPESTQEERKEAFELNRSVDQIVLKNEPLTLEGREVTIEEILRQLQGHKDFRQLFPSIQETEIGGYIRRPVFAPKAREDAPAVYYGVREVRPGENLWKLHYRIIQEYMARRHIILPPTADEPFPDGRSSGVGRLLKYIENVVVVYNMDQDRLEKDLNAIQPSSVLVFFKISDLFAVLDQLRAEDLRWVRYVNNRLRIERPEESRDLLGTLSPIEEKMR